MIIMQCSYLDGFIHKHRHILKCINNRSIEGPISIIAIFFFLFNRINDRFGLHLYILDIMDIFFWEK